MNHNDLPPRWRTKLAEWIHQHTGGTRDQLKAGDVPIDQKLLLKFDDGSEASFNYAIAIEAPHLQEVGVFTEHCGYHVFFSPGLVVTRKTHGS